MLDVEELIERSIRVNSSLKEFKQEQQTLEKKISDDEKELDILNQVKTYLISFSEFARDRVKNKLEEIVNKALKAIIFDQNISFKIIPNRQKKNVVYDLYVECDGKVDTLLDSNGGGTLNVISIALKIAFLKFFEATNRQTMVLDEPFKDLSAKYIPYGVEWLKEISEQFSIQFIIVSHIVELQENADKSFQVIKKNGKSTVKEFENI